jgi:hypothetical protein
MFNICYCMYAVVKKNIRVFMIESKKRMVFDSKKETLLSLFLNAMWFMQGSIRNQHWCRSVPGSLEKGECRYRLKTSHFHLFCLTPSYWIWLDPNILWSNLDQEETCKASIQILCPFQRLSKMCIIIKFSKGCRIHIREITIHRTIFRLNSFHRAPNYFCF